MLPWLDGGVSNLLEEFLLFLFSWLMESVRRTNESVRKTSMSSLTICPSSGKICTQEEADDRDC